MYKWFSSGEIFASYGKHNFKAALFQNDNRNLYTADGHADIIKWSKTFMLWQKLKWYLCASNDSISLSDLEIIGLINSKLVKKHN